ncbi:MAG: sigma-70 domain-containing protein [Clostridiales bacterium]|nr:sigma-70 domain-containing protein [Clostridiales bacterium]
MDQKEVFRNGLQRMRKMAEANHNHVTVGDILSCFPEMELNQDQIRLIYQYAEEEHIVIEDYQLHDTRSVSVGEKKLSGEEKAYFKMYLEDLKAITPCTAEEEMMLMERLSAGEEEVITRLTEGYLHSVLELARKHSGNGVLIGDLVQEGNMELMIALSDISAGAVLLAGGHREYILNRIDEVMKALIAEQSGYHKAGEKMARETNRLLAATMELEDELGREATLEELAKKVQLPEDKVKELIQISLNAAEFSADQEGNEDRGEGNQDGGEALTGF